MVQFEDVQHLRGDRLPESYDLDDVMLFVENDMEGIRQRFDKMPFLPFAMPEVEGELMLKEAYDPTLEDVYLEKTRYFESDEFRGQWGPEQNALNSYRTAANLIRLTFNLLATLQDPERPITYETLTEFGGFIHHEDPNSSHLEYVTAEFQYYIPSCNYLTFLAEGCEKLRREPLFFDCFLLPYDDGDYDPYIGWLASKDGAALSVTVRWRDNDNAPRVFLESLLRFMFDVHLHDVQMLVNGLGEYRLFSGYALPLVWVAMRKALVEDGRPGVCCVCGKHFVATDERGFRRRYCGKDSCRKAYQRVKRALRQINDGRSIEEAVRRTPSISLARVVDISLRNKDVLEREFPNVDFDELARRR